MKSMNKKSQEPRKARGMKSLIQTIMNNSLSIVLFTLFVVCVSAQSLAGWRVQNETLAAHRQSLISYRHFLSTGAFWEGLASNWHAAVLQLGSLIVFSAFLYQRGAPHSRDPVAVKRKHTRQSRSFSWFYRNSLSLAFLLLFALALVLHIVFGTRGYNEERELMGQSPISIAAFLLSAKFWSTTLQTWQAEYLVIAIYVVLTIFLRQEGSPESKPVESRNATTGEANK
jgi:hypothetical protein